MSISQLSVWLSLTPPFFAALRPWRGCPWGHPPYDRPEAMRFSTSLPTGDLQDHDPHDRASRTNFGDVEFAEVNLPPNRQHHLPVRHSRTVRGDEWHCGAPWGTGEARLGTLGRVCACRNISPNRTLPSYSFTLGHLPSRLPLLLLNYLPFPIDRGHSGHLDEDPIWGSRSRCCCCPLSTIVLTDVDVTAEEFAPAVRHCRTKRGARHRTGSPSYDGKLRLVDDTTARCPSSFWSTQGERRLCSKNSAPTVAAAVRTPDPLLFGRTGPWDPPANFEALNLRISSLPSRHAGTAMTVGHCLAVRRWWGRQAHCSRWSPGYQIVYPPPAPPRSCSVASIGTFGNSAPSPFSSFVLTSFSW